jgi:hypothetical protein
VGCIADESVSRNYQRVKYGSDGRSDDVLIRSATLSFRVTHPPSLKDLSPGRNI